MKWIACTGGKRGKPCRIETVSEDNKSTEVKHQGRHNHPRVPDAKTHPRARRRLEQIVEFNPELTPAQLQMGARGRPPVSKLSPSFHNKSLLTQMRHQILSKNRHHKPDGIRMSVGALIKFSQDLPETFFVDFNIVDLHAQVISMQTDGMREVLQNTVGGLQTDTVEGIVTDADFNGHAHVHFTSAFCTIQMRWVPVLISIVFGQTHRHFQRHWKFVLESLADTVNDSWESFCKGFPGVTMDWSLALSKGFKCALIAHAKNHLGKHDLTESDVDSFLRFCSVHFKRSVTRLARNSNVVPHKQTKRIQEVD